MNGFQDRAEAGRRLGKALQEYAQTDALVLALPRGGVPVAFEVAKTLELPLDLMVVRKLGVPGHEELAMGAIAMGGGRYLNTELIHSLRITPDQLESVEATQRQELERRQRVYRGKRPMPEIAGRTVILIDDGVATGATLRAAIGSVKSLKPHKLVVAVPVAPPETVRELEQEADKVVCLLQPPMLEAVGLWYESFPQTSDEEVIALLQEAQKFSAKALPNP